MGKFSITWVCCRYTFTLDGALGLPESPKSGRAVGVWRRCAACWHASPERGGVTDGLVPGDGKIHAAKSDRRVAGSALPRYFNDLAYAFLSLFANSALRVDYDRMLKRGEPLRLPLALAQQKASFVGRAYVATLADRGLPARRGMLRNMVGRRSIAVRALVSSMDTGSNLALVAIAGLCSFGASTSSTTHRPIIRTGYAPVGVGMETGGGARRRHARTRCHRCC